MNGSVWLNNLLIGIGCDLLYMLDGRSLITSKFSLEHLNDLSNVSDLIAAIIKQIDEEKCDLDVKTLDYLFRCLSKDLNL